MDEARWTPEEAVTHGHNASFRKQFPRLAAPCGRKCGKGVWRDR